MVADEIINGTLLSTERTDILTWRFFSDIRTKDETGREVSSLKKLQILKLMFQIDIGMQQSPI